ncbi:hypothetical protein CR513_09974, partial [Mucuna pruriens]
MSTRKDLTSYVPHVHIIKSVSNCRFNASSSKTPDLQYGEQHITNQLIELTSLVRQLIVGQHQPSIIARVCGICTSMEHPTDMCPHCKKMSQTTQRVLEQ